MRHSLAAIVVAAALLAPSAAAAKPATATVGSETPLTCSSGIVVPHGDVEGIEASRPSGRSRTLVTIVGGFDIADDNFRLTLRSDGRGTLVDRGRRRAVSVDAPRLRRLEDELAAAHFRRLKHDYAHVVVPIRGPAPTGVTYRGETVIVQPGARVPAALGRVIATLRAIAGRA